MDLVTTDFETFWSQTHSLSKMNPFDYVMHPETELISVSLKINDQPTQCVFGEKLIRELLMDTVKWNDAYAIAHNMSGFDAFILSWRLGISPRLWGCTLAMARPIFAKTMSLSLASLVKHFGLGEKNNAALINTRGKHLKDFTVQELRDMAKYNCDDSDQCYGVFKALRPYFSGAELWHIDAKIRALVEPKFVIDQPMLQAALVEERANKRRTLIQLAEVFKDQVLPVGELASANEDYLIERVRATLASAPMFSKLLEDRGVPVPMKESPSNPDLLIPALAKSDEEFMALQEHEDEIVAMAATARLSVKSTIAETRMEKFLEAAQHTGGRWPVTVDYCGADTTGRGSGWFYNPLNLPRINTKKPKPADALRMCLMAPPGYKVVVVDASGIEMRFNHFLWNVAYSTELWRSKPDADIYKPTAAQFYGIDVSEVDPQQRQVGKVQQLACGFGCGKVRYVGMARTQGGLILTLDESEAQVNNWRTMTPEIADRKNGGWKRCERALSWIVEGIERPIDPHEIFWTCREGIRLPSGRIIRYPDLRKQMVMRKRDGKAVDEETWMYGTGRHQTFIHGPKVDENIVQAGARDLVYDYALEVYRRTGHRMVQEVYDELVWIVPEDEAEHQLAVANEVFRTPSSWFPSLVTWSEGDIGDRYGEAK